MVANLFQWAIHLSWSEAEDSQSTFFIGLVSGLSLAHTSSWVAVNGSQICCVRWQSDPEVLVAATTEITLSYSHSRWSLFKQKEVFSLPFQLPDWVWTFTCCIFSTAECLEPSPSTQTLLLCFHRVWSNPTVHWWHNGKAIPICDLWIGSWNFLCLCLWLSKDQSNKVVMGFVLFPWTKHWKAELSEGFWFRGLREGPVAHSNLSWNAEARDAVLGLNFWMLEWTMNCVFIFCWHVVP